MAQRTNTNSKFIPVSINGKTVKVSLASFSQRDTDMHHGKTATGNQVNSARSAGIGNSQIIWPTGDINGPAFAIGKDDLEVLSRDYLKTRGYNVTIGDASSNSAS